MKMVIIWIGSEVESDWDVGVRLDVQVIKLGTVVIRLAVEEVESGTVYPFRNFGELLKRIESKGTYMKLCRFIDPLGVEPDLDMAPIRVMVMFVQDIATEFSICIQDLVAEYHHDGG